MQVFRCPACSSPVYFHNLACGCGQEVSFDPDAQTMVAGAPHCTNRDDIACNWVAEEGGLCRSCAMTETVPDLRAEQNLPLWESSEYAKRRMLAELGRWGWFTSNDAGARPVFRMLSEETLHGEEDVIMGHADGLITINVTEASDPVLAERQEQFDELYRTMLGHMRHEMAHFLFLRLAGEPGFLDSFRPLFGDEREDYGAALQRHYDAPADPGETHITHYATAHPHEDWAETLAHLQHLVSMLDSGVASGLRLPGMPGEGYDPYLEADTDALITQAVNLSIAVNHVNRALDLPDLYPFVLTQPVREKMALAHRWLRRL
ncbi:putative zinc-binding metallopeptidase [Salipiger sp. PrR002]|uniref:zinc-binding metallopeptidase family protein n=1 Tax=Salipiger sp. PrR002 TaxID=2706489 RepID=UPI0013BA0D27|nr:putative zinc-binding metallopeptidase [Salipiger sp. PrR002]NDV98488.1 hypothetical protein [Salipiger sp. PrR002]NDW57323.1 hypothetical protein [Salipiger sp. PrR004]